MSMSSSDPYPSPPVDESGIWIYRTQRASDPAAKQPACGGVSCSSDLSGVSA